MEKKNTTLDLYNGIKDALKYCQSKSFYAIHENTCVLDGTTTKANYDYCEKNNLKVYYLGTKGGVTILQEGNISIAIIDNYEDMWHKMDIVTDKLIKLLKSKGFNSYYEDNDVLVDGFKVCAFSKNMCKEKPWGYATLTFTINIDLDLIQNICNKPMIKVPKGLTEFGITTEDIEKLIKNL